MEKKTSQTRPTFSFPFFNKYFRALKAGKVVQYSDREINRIIDRYYLNEEAITELPEKEAKILREKIFIILQSFFHDSFISDIAGSDILCLNQEQIEAMNKETGSSHTIRKEGGKFLIDLSASREKEKVIEFCQKEKIITMSPQEKVDFLKNLTEFLSANFSSGCMTGTCNYMGYRDIIRYDVGRIKNLLAEIRLTSGRKNLTVLDLGGGIGLGLAGLKELDPDIYAINLTLHAEAAMYKTDRTILSPAERFPKSLKENVDLVISNMAFRYFRFPDLAVRNVVHSLRVGGIANIFVTCERSGGSDAELKRRLNKTYDWLQELIEQGVLAIDFSYGGPFGEPLKIKKLFPCRGLLIRKLKSLD
jgi:SAM-dependent methyltransferase